MSSARPQRKRRRPRNKAEVNAEADEEDETGLASDFKALVDDLGTSKSAASDPLEQWTRHLADNGVHPKARSSFSIPLASATFTPSFRKVPESTGEAVQEFVTVGEETKNKNKDESPHSEKKRRKSKGQF